MDESDVVSFGPTAEASTVNQDDTIPLEASASTRNAEISTERMVTEARSEIRAMVDKCMSELSEKMEIVMANFEYQVGAHSKKNTPILGRGVRNSSTNVRVSESSTSNVNNNNFLQNKGQVQTQR